MSGIHCPRKTQPPARVRGYPTDRSGEAPVALLASPCIMVCNYHTRESHLPWQEIPAQDRIRCCCPACRTPLKQRLHSHIHIITQAGTKEIFRFDPVDHLEQIHMAIFEQSNEHGRPSDPPLPENVKPPRIRRRDVTVIGSTWLVRNKPSSAEGLMIDGNLECAMAHHERHLTISEHARVEANIHAGYGRRFRTTYWKHLQ